VYPGTPPVGERQILPLLFPLQSTLTIVGFGEIVSGSTIVIVSFITQPTSSVPVTQYVPEAGHKFETEFPLELSNQRIVYGATPPVGLIVAKPSHDPLQVTSVEDELSWKTGGAAGTRAES